MMEQQNENLAPPESDACRLAFKSMSPNENGLVTFEAFSAWWNRTQAKVVPGEKKRERKSTDRMSAYIAEGDEEYIVGESPKQNTKKKAKVAAAPLAKPAVAAPGPTKAEQSRNLPSSKAS